MKPKDFDPKTITYEQLRKYSEAEERFFHTNASVTPEVQAEISSAIEEIRKNHK